MTEVLTQDALRACLEERLVRFVRLARSLTDNDADAEDAVQNAVVRALAGERTFRGEADVCTWVHRIVVNSATDLQRRRATERRHRDPAGIESRWRDPAYTVNPEDVAASLADGNRLRTALAHLTPTQRTVVLLHDVEQWTTEEIAQVLEMPRPTVKSHLRRGRQALVSLLAEAQ